MTTQTTIQPIIPVNEAVAQAYTNLTTMYELFDEMRQNDFPEDITRTLYDELIDRATTMLREVNADYQNYIRQNIIRTREARRALYAQQPPRQPRQAQPQHLRQATEPIPTLPNDDEDYEPIVRHRRHVSRALTKREMDVVMPEPCGICYDTYTKLNSVSTCCGHSFCKDCFTSHENATRSQPITCPLCRKMKPIVTEYRGRKSPNTGRASSTDSLIPADV